MTNISEKSNNCTRDATNWNNSILIVSCMSRDEKQLMRKNCKRISRFKCKYLSNCCCSFCVRYFSAFSLFYAHTFWSDCTFSTCASLVFFGQKFFKCDSHIRSVLSWKSAIKRWCFRFGTLILLDYFYLWNS